MPEQLAIIDDDVQFSRMLGEVAGAIGFNYAIFHDARDYFKQNISSDLIILDLNMPDMDGIEVIRKLASVNSKAQMLLISGYDVSVLLAAEKLAEEHQLNIVGSLTKPVRVADLQVLLKSAQVSTEQQQVRTVPHKFNISEQALRQAVESDQLALFFQPQVDLFNNKVAGVEALVRWIHPEHGLISPAEFIPLAERTGLIGDLTSWVINQAIKQIIDWQMLDLKIPVSVNVSAENITSLRLPEELSQLIQSNRLDPSLIVLEITESALMGELVTSLDILTRLRMKGFQLSIDDFGTGYSSLSLLHKIPFTELKIDQQFVLNLDSDPMALAIVETCIMLGHKLDMRVVAEGVENARVIEILNMNECDVIQGFHIAKPMPANDFLVWFHQSAFNQ